MVTGTKGCGGDGGDDDEYYVYLTESDMHDWDWRYRFFVMVY